MQKVLVAFFRHLNGKAPYFETGFRMKRYDMTWRHVTVRGKVIERASNGEPVRITGTICVDSLSPGEPAVREDTPEEPSS
jgi:hypothetical protein